MGRRRIWPKNCIMLKKQTLVEDVKRLAKESQSSPAAWITELVEDFIKEHRSNKPFKGELDRFTERHNDFDMGEYEIDPYLLQQVES